MRKVGIALLIFTFTLFVLLFFGIETRLAFANPLNEELVRVGGFSVALSDVQREGDTAVLYFSITKIADPKKEFSEISVILEDDHDNQYEGMLNIKAGIEDPKLVSDILNSLPIGFTHIEIIRIRMPQVAPIMKISLNDEEFDFASVKLVKPSYQTDYGALSLSRGQPVEVGKWLVFSISHIEPEISRWELVVDLANNDYNSLSGSVKIGVQEDGILSWSEQTLIEVPGLGQVKTSVVLPISRWKAGELPQPRNLLLQLQDQKTYEQVMKVYPIQEGELPPIVGLSQSPYTNEKMFISAYERYEGKARLGNPTSLRKVIGTDTHFSFLELYQASKMTNNKITFGGIIMYIKGDAFKELIEFIYTKTVNTSVLYELYRIFKIATYFLHNSSYLVKLEGIHNM